MERITTGEKVFIYPLSILGGLGILTGSAFTLHFTFFHTIPITPPVIE
jgi:hypothetical protein